MRNNNSRPAGTKAIPMPDANTVRGPHARHGNRDKGQSSRKQMNRGDPKTRHAKRCSGNHPYQRPVAPNSLELGTTTIGPVVPKQEMMLMIKLCATNVVVMVICNGLVRLLPKKLKTIIREES